MTSRLIDALKTLFSGGTTLGAKETALAKRAMEKTMREHGIPGRLAKTVASHHFSLTKGTK